jgi:N-acetylglutamate synthase-like GNAT family acetyltransferase
MATPVRAATREDLPEILRIVNLAYRVEDFFIAGDRIDLPQLRARFEQPGAELLVIDAPEPARLVAAVHFEDRGDHGWFGLLAVDPAAQGAGHARTLIHAMEDRCRALGLTSLMIEVWWTCARNCRRSTPGWGSLTLPPSRSTTRTS